MTKTTVEVEARLSVLDQATSALGSKLNAMANQLKGFHQRILGDSQRAQQHSLGQMNAAWGHRLAAVASGGMFAFAIQDQVALDRLSKQTQAIVEMSDEQWAKARRTMGELGTELGKSPEEMMKGAKAWLELGNSVESYIENVKIAGKTSRITGISIGEQMAETSAIMRAFGVKPEDHEKFREFERTYLVGSKGMLHGAHAYGQAMKNFAPIAKSLGMDVNEASSFVQALGGQFHAEEIGNAFKMGFARLMAPTPKAVSNMRGVGIDPLQVWGFSPEAIAGSGRAFAERLRGAGMVVRPELEKSLSTLFETTDTSKGGKLLTDKLQETLAQAYGQIGRGGKATMTGDTSRLLAAVIAQHLGSLKGKLNIEQFFTLLGQHADNVPLIKELFGGHHIAKFQDLLRQGEHVFEQMRKNKGFADSIVDGKDVVDRRAAIAMKGLAFEYDRMSTSWKRLVTVLSGGEADDQGSFRGLAKVYESIADSIAKVTKSISETDPKQIESIGKALIYMGTAAASIAALGVAMAGVARAVTVIGGAAPWLLGGTLAYTAWDKHQKSAAMIAADNALLGAETTPAGRQAALQKLLKERTPGGLAPLLLKGLRAIGIDIGTPDFSLGNMFDLGPRKSAARVEGEITIKVEGPGKITDAKATGIALNTGQSMPDTWPQP